jgi:transposase
VAEEIGPNPTDRGKPGSKRHVVVDRHGTPLAIWLTPANVHDGQLLTALVDAIEPIHRPRGQAGRPRRRPDKLHADKAYSSRANRRALRVRGITPRIARPGIESSERLGRYRWVVERALAWLGRFRRLAIRYERRADIHLAFLDLGCALVCFNRCRGTGTVRWNGRPRHPRAPWMARTLQHLGSC